MRKIIFIFIALLSVGFSAYSQEAKKEKDWYIEAGGGAQLLFSSDASDLKFSKRITPAISLTGGKWFSPYWGVRLQIGGYSLNGNSSPFGLYLADPLGNGLYGQNDPVRDHVKIRPDGSYRHYLRYVNAHVDFQLSLFNLIKGREHTSKWDIIPAVGIGYFRTFKYKGTPVTHNISNHVSVMGKYNVYKNLDINLEAFASFLPDDFDGRITKNRYEFNTGITLGVTYNFKTSKKRKCEIPPVQIVTEIIRDTITIVKEIEVEIPVKTENNSFIIASIRFDIGQTTPIENQEVQYENVSNYLKQNPQARILLSGYADKDTGTPEFNLRLSADRAMNVREILINSYAIESSRIETQGIGVNEQPYDHNDWNRVVTITVIE